MGQASSPLDHGTVVFGVESPGVAPGSPACDAGVVLLDHDPNKRKPWDSNPQTAKPSPVFRTGSSSGRMASVKLRGLESNQRPPGSEPGVTTNSNCPGSSSRRDRSRSGQARGEGVGPSSPGSKPGGLPLTDPRSSYQKCPAGIEPASPAWKAGAFAARPRAH